MCKMKDTLILNDGTVVELETGASLSYLGVLSESKTAMVEVWNKMNAENLSFVQVKNGDGLVVANYENLVLVSETSTIKADGSILTNFNLREKSQEEIDIAELQADMEALNGAFGGE